MENLPANLLDTAVVACVAVVGYLFLRVEPKSPLLKGAADDEARFKLYVRRELRKAQIGAKDAAQWAKDLVSTWEKNHDQ